MMVRIPWAARWDILDAADEYEAKLEGLGSRFMSAVDVSIKRIGNSPRLYSAALRTPRNREVRFGLVRRFPYAVYFEVLASEVVILAVVHVRRHQRTWRSRL